MQAMQTAAIPLFNRRQTWLRSINIEWIRYSRGSCEARLYLKNRPIVFTNKRKNFTQCWFISLQRANCLSVFSILFKVFSQLHYSNLSTGFYAVLTQFQSTQVELLSAELSRFAIYILQAEDNFGTRRLL